jgi:hypothetical protein
MNPKLTIQFVSVDGPHTYVKASIVAPQKFLAVSKGSRLGGVRLKSFLAEPEPGSGNYTFQIENPEEAGKLRTGETVELET